MKIALEGPSFAGKTTFCQKTAERDCERYAYIPEYVTYAGGGGKFPTFPPTDISAAREAFEFFFALEARRQRDVLQCHQPFVLLDRSVFTLAAFEYAVTPITGIDALRYAEKRILSHKEWWPDVVVVLKVPRFELERRAQEPSGRMSIFLDREFNARVYEYLFQLTKRFNIRQCNVTADQLEKSTIEALLAAR